MKELTLVIIAIAMGYALSAITAILYRIVTQYARHDGGLTVKLAVMAIAGPSVFFEKGIQRFLDREWSAAAFWFTAAGIAYWSFALGLLTIHILLYVEQPL